MARTVGLYAYRVTKLFSDVSLEVNGDDIPRHVSHVRRVPRTAEDSPEAIHYDVNSSSSSESDSPEAVHYDNSSSSSESVILRKKTIYPIHLQLQSRPKVSDEDRHLVSAVSERDDSPLIYEITLCNDISIVDC